MGERYRYINAHGGYFAFDVENDLMFLSDIDTLSEHPDFFSFEKVSQYLCKA